MAEGRRDEGEAAQSLFVTGGHGFVGQWIQRAPAAQRPGHRYRLCLPPPDFDLLDEQATKAQVAAASPGAVLHLAAQSNVARSFEDPEGTFRVNVTGTLRLFEALAAQCLAPRTVFASSGDVYGHVPGDAMPVSESRIPEPRNPYAKSKLAAEALCRQWSADGALPIVIARPFNHVGAGQSDAFVLPAFARQIAEIKGGRREPVIEVGDIDVTRDFTHVADIVEAYFLLLEEGEPGETYNICSGTDLRVRDLLERMLEIAGVKAEIRRDPSRLRPAEQRVVRGDNAKIRALGWTPKRSIDEALAEILADWERRTRQ